MTRHQLILLILLAPDLLLPLSARGQGDAEVLVDWGSDWRFRVGSLSLGDDWVQPDALDALWSSVPAPIGFGTSRGAAPRTIVDGGPSDNRRRSFYFRHTFEVADPLRFRLLSVRVWRDDGFVLYLNGTEVMRGNMPLGPVTANTLSADGVFGDEEWIRLWQELPASHLRAGTNTLAVSMHQYEITSSDLHFDLQLEGLLDDGEVLDEVELGAVRYTLNHAPPRISRFAPDGTVADEVELGGRADRLKVEDGQILARRESGGAFRYSPGARLVEILPEVAADVFEPDAVVSAPVEVTLPTGAVHRNATAVLRNAGLYRLDWSAAPGSPSVAEGAPGVGAASERLRDEMNSGRFSLRNLISMGSLRSDSISRSINGYLWHYNRLSVAGTDGTSKVLPYTRGVAVSGSDPPDDSFPFDRGAAYFTRVQENLFTLLAVFDGARELQIDGGLGNMGDQFRWDGNPRGFPMVHAGVPYRLVSTDILRPAGGATSFPGVYKLFLVHTAHGDVGAEFGSTSESDRLRIYGLNGPTRIHFLRYHTPDGSGIGLNSTTVARMYLDAIEPVPPWISLGTGEVPLSGTLPPGEAVTLPLTIDARDLPPGEHATVVTLSTNDPDTPLLHLPVRLHVITAEPGHDLDGDGVSDVAEIAAGTDPANPRSATRPGILDVTNPGSVRPSYKISLPFAPGRRYTLQFKDDLSSPSWSDLHDADPRSVILRNGIEEIEIVDRDIPRRPTRFYRVLIRPQ